MVATAAMQSKPPLTRAVRPELALATRPPRMFPTSGPACPTICSAAATRPRNTSGVCSWTIVLRDTTDMVSATPARTRNVSATHRFDTTPNRASAAPQVAEPHSMTIPGRAIRVNVPEKTDAITPPTAIAVRNSPRVRGLLWKRSALISGKRLIGNDRTVVARSVSRAPRTAGVRSKIQDPLPPQKTLGGTAHPAAAWQAVRTPRRNRPRT